VTAERFSLLPARYAENVAERRWARLVAAALVVVLGLLGLMGLSQGRALRHAEKKRDVEQVRNAALAARAGQLLRFRRLADAVAGRERLLAAAMGTEVSWATVLTSLAQQFPADSSLTSLSAESKLPAFGTLPAVKVGNEKSMIGSAALKGYSIEKFTPGVERLLQTLVSVRGLSEPRLQVGTVNEIGNRPVTSFDGDAFVDARAMSGRYARGLPAEDDIEIPSIVGGSSTNAAPSATPPGGPK
jgi:Tfp pilus assembly protein PilN